VADGDDVLHADADCRRRRRRFLGLGSAGNQ
jgi:hypothetical protein